MYSAIQLPKLKIWRETRTNIEYVGEMYKRVIYISTERSLFQSPQQMATHAERRQTLQNIHFHYRRLSASYSPFLALVGSFAFRTFSKVHFGHSQPHARNILNLKPNHTIYCMKNVTLETSAKSSRLSSSQGDQYSRTVWNSMIFPGLFAALIFLSVLLQTSFENVQNRLVSRKIHWNCVTKQPIKHWRSPKHEVRQFSSTKMFSNTFPRADKIPRHFQVLPDKWPPCSYTHLAPIVHPYWRGRPHISQFCWFAALW